MKAYAMTAWFLLVPSVASAGEVFGKIMDGDSSVGAAATVEAKCGTTSVPAVATDKSGSYHLVLDKPGKCTLTVKYKDQSADLGIASYDDPVQVDIALETKEGRLTARRK